MHAEPVAIVTGSSRGIGRGIAERLAAAGYAVVVNFRSNRAAAQQTLEALQRSQAAGHLVQADVALAADRQRLVQETLDRYGRLDVLVNNAGITSPGRRDLLEATEESWDQVFNTNLKGPFFLAQAVARAMRDAVQGGRQPGGTIINISSISAYAVSSNRADYCMAKAAMGMMTWLLAERLAEYQILVYEVCPGIIASDMTAPVKEKYDQLIRDGMTPIRRWGQPQDVAKAVEMLVGDTLSFSTGQCIHVDGGFHIRRL